MCSGDLRSQFSNCPRDAGVTSPARNSTNQAEASAMVSGLKDEVRVIMQSLLGSYAAVPALAAVFRRPGEILLGRLAGYTHLICDFLNREPADPMQHERRADPRRQAREDPLELLNALCVVGPCRRVLAGRRSELGYRVRDVNER